MTKTDFDIESVTITYSDRVITHIQFWYDAFGHLYYRLKEHQFGAVEHPKKLRDYEPGRAFASLSSALGDALANIRTDDSESEG